MQTYWLSCRNHTDNIGSKRVIMKKKAIRQVLKCINCVAKEIKVFKTKV